ncbi:hypothetical protein A33K_18569 [Burkholderia humptydooensis MSMB43]|uniref:Uncharacterized protein n=1 Tax=Burkholderia humptydooensis MSMB43 TaxID=441157 RepID=A0ABN0FXQ4_9BURK|nr:hypothetical protein A33K_18569 [Burkholderia humptydooensis MSMB43]
MVPKRDSDQGPAREGGLAHMAARARTRPIAAAGGARGRCAACSSMAGEAFAAHTRASLPVIYE